MDSSLKFFSGALTYVHWRFKDEYYNKAFNEATRLFMQAHNVNDRTMLRSAMVQYAQTIKNIDTLKNLYE